MLLHWALGKHYLNTHGHHDMHSGSLPCLSQDTPQQVPTRHLLDFGGPCRPSGIKADGFLPNSLSYDSVYIQGCIPALYLMESMEGPSTTQKTADHLLDLDGTLEIGREQGDRVNDRVWPLHEMLTDHLP